MITFVIKELFTKGLPTNKILEQIFQVFILELVEGVFTVFTTLMNYYIQSIDEKNIVCLI